ncbi:MAG TPA: N-acetylmuramoyl-L-alanine amidase [Clostridiales bacterium]|nr:N-acetylmuramoyl-L-alanine amidase [Clostridiales bacterium]
MKRNNFIVTVIFIILLTGLFLYKEGDGVKYLLSDKSRKITVVLDAGHGNFDPGKIGINKAVEKDINLSITYKLKALLEDNGINVVMTRTDDNCLCKKSDTDKKRADMKRRVSIINSSGALIAVSIHQNSFTQESSRGAQVFYYQNSEKGQILAEMIQDSIKGYIKDGNHRLAKANSSYYLLRYSNCPLVIVECGFLSNRAEAELLCTDAYQDKMAWAIHLGIIEYINSNIADNAVPLVEKNE